MVTHGDKQVEEHLSALLHLALHRTATLESVAAAYDESEIVSSKLRVAVGSMGVGPAS